MFARPVDSWFAIFSLWPTYCPPFGLLTVPQKFNWIKDSFDNKIQLKTHLLWSANSYNEIPVIPLCTELQFGVFLNTKMCCFWAERLKFNTKWQCAKIPLTGKKVLEREGLEIGHLRGNLTSGHNTCKCALAPLSAPPAVPTITGVTI